MKIFSQIFNVSCIIAIGLVGCASNDQNTIASDSNSYQVKSPFEKVDVAFEEYSIINEEGGRIETENGGFITVPKNAFVDAEGVILTGPITVKFRSFDNAAEIIASGIPMTYDSAGVSGDFQSAGMYEIKAEAKGEVVNLKEGAEVVVGLANSRGDGNYDFYDLKKDGNWEYNFNCKPTVNEKYAAAKDSVKKKMINKIAVEPIEADDNTHVFDFAFNKSDFPELAVFHNILWSAYGENKNFLKFVAQKNAVNFSLAESDEYAGVYTFSFEIDGKVKIGLVQPVFLGKDLAKAKEEFKKKLKLYKAEFTAKIEEIDRKFQEQKFLRTSAISGMGIYNYDRLIHNSNALVKNFEFKVPTNPNHQIEKVFLVSNGQDVVYYNRDRFDKLAYIPTDHNIIVTILPNDQIAYKHITSEFDLKKDWSVELEIAPAKIESPSDLQTILASL